MIEVNHCDRRKRRNNGKSDTIDAETAARAVLAGIATAVPKTADGAAEMVRQIKIARDTVTNRHRLFRGGHRQANAALSRIVIVRMRWHQPTIDYVERRTAQGLSKKDVMRCLKRFVAREIYNGLITDHRARPPLTLAA